jgi:uncharacterized protein
VSVSTGKLPLGLVVAGALVAIGIAAGGWLLGKQIHDSRIGDRFVTVKGLAEREVTADLAIWPLSVSATGDDLGLVQAKIDADLAAITRFLLDKGFAPEEVQPQRVQVTDLLAQAYRQEGAGENRYIILQTVTVRSTNVALVDQISREVGELVKRGVVLSDGSGPTYLFTRLNEVKPSMIAEAMESARAGAEQFATDSDSGVGGIRRANQGVFVILPRDETDGVWEPTQLNKKVRVVSTIEYYLVD